MKRLIVTTAMLLALCACSEPDVHTYTAEEVFAANFPAGVYKGSGLNVGEFHGIKASVLSRSELRRYQRTIKVGELIDLKLFFKDCPRLSSLSYDQAMHIILAVETEMAAMFNPDQLTAAETKMGSNAALREQMQAEAWEREGRSDLAVNSAMAWLRASAAAGTATTSTRPDSDRHEAV